jgi:RecB family exonuclease
MEFLYPVDGPSGPAGDTGTATHKAVEEFHKTEGDVAAAIAAMHANTPRYPLAKLDEATNMFLAYASDPRNRTAKVRTDLLEKRIRFKIEPAPEDPTQKEIMISGRLDQIRLDKDNRLWDLKTSKKDPYTVLLDTMFQAAAYCVGATLETGEQVHPGGIITPRHYLTNSVLPSNSPPKIFWHFAWTLQDAEHILDGVRRIVASIRRHAIYHVPGEEVCHWCIARSPDACLPKLKEFKRGLPLVSNPVPPSA